MIRKTHARDITAPQLICGEVIGGGQLGCHEHDTPRSGVPRCKTQAALLTCRALGRDMYANRTLGSEKETLYTTSQLKRIEDALHNADCIGIGYPETR